jgi:uracil phosphoribosyltransferase
VVDPCIATSNTIHAVVSILEKWGAKRIVVISAIGARSGVERLAELHPKVEIHIGAIDETLSESGMILPGIGDAGDRQFGTHHDVDVNLLPNLPESPVDKKRKRGDKN